MRSSKGFTLLEIMLVLLLMGMISVGVVMTLPSSANLDKSSEWHAQRFSTLLQFAEDHALISNTELGIEFGEQQYQFAYYDLKQKKWRPFTDSRISGTVEIPYSISAKYTLSGSVWDEIDQEDDDPFLEREYLVEVEGDKKEVKINPQVFIMSSGEVTPFSYQFYNTEIKEKTVTVNVGMSGQIELVSEQ
ncbi:type II secretion system protein GspH [Psychromonas sp. RZ22]|uniref:type II secretion system minor pseudopilin GspH n=1 Tax=Psychromonas algarum TaxID=2555643 RepID=UPI001067395E|nr:type II secretion system minor pseudopilin GspH [Psychromonas sp. RZ22]TEW53943.1 type II secretion system protein GspH [Psychromonas sp. RZ22]